MDGLTINKMIVLAALGIDDEEKKKQILGIVNGRKAAKDMFGERVAMKLSRPQRPARWQDALRYITRPNTGVG